MSFIEVHPRCSGPHLHQTALHCSFSLCLFEASLLSGRSLHFFFSPQAPYVLSYPHQAISLFSLPFNHHVSLKNNN